MLLRVFGVAYFSIDKDHKCADLVDTWPSGVVLCWA